MGLFRSFRGSEMAAMVVSAWMRRALARGHDHLAEEHTTGGTVPAPALKGGPREAMVLDEPVVQTPEERECVRWAKQERTVASAADKGAPVAISPVGTWREGRSIA
jgi:hypothetical protein